LLTRTASWGPAFNSAAACAKHSLQIIPEKQRVLAANITRKPAVAIVQSAGFP